jgi:hypothetical protein
MQVRGVACDADLRSVRNNALGFIADCRALEPSFWYLMTVIMLFYGIVIPVQARESVVVAWYVTRMFAEFSSCIIDYSCKRKYYAHSCSHSVAQFELSDNTASAYTSLISFLSMVLSSVNDTGSLLRDTLLTRDAVAGNVC